MRNLLTKDREAISDMIHLYFWLADSGRADEIPGLFSPRATLTFGAGSPNPGTISGEDLQQTFIERAAQTDVTTRHVVSNIHMTMTAEDSVDTRCILTLYRSDTEARDSHPLMVADVVDEFVNESGQWAIQKREITPVFSRQR